MSFFFLPPPHLFMYVVESSTEALLLSVGFGSSGSCPVLCGGSELSPLCRAPRCKGTGLTRLRAVFSHLFVLGMRRNSFSERTVIQSCTGSGGGARSLVSSSQKELKPRAGRAACFSPSPRGQPLVRRPEPHRPLIPKDRATRRSTANIPCGFRAPPASCQGSACCPPRAPHSPLHTNAPLTAAPPVSAVSVHRRRSGPPP